MLRKALLIILASSLVCGCARKESGAVSAPAPAAPAASTAAPSPMEALDRLDARKPVPLLPMMAEHQKRNMRDHLASVQEVVAALAKSDFEAIEKSAARMGFSETMGQMCTHMGSGAPGFADQAIAFHRTADGIISAARARDRDGVTAELGRTLATCTACHATWKQQIVDEPTWNALSGDSERSMSGTAHHP